MIGYLTGKLFSKKPTRILLDVNGVGYSLNISLNTFDKLPDEGNIISLYTYLAVKEDSLTLYGFSSEPEKQMFEMLISVNGIGPKLAQSVLSGIQIDELKDALSTGNISRLIAIPGIGRKTAERMLIDLKDKMDLIIEEKDISVTHKIKDDAVAAITTLGYNLKMSEKIIRDILTENQNIEIEDLIRQALGEINK
jgi:Holliday junction DNA helicase RuvA